jgi:hypothetical protein
MRFEQAAPRRLLGHKDQRRPQAVGVDLYVILLFLRYKYRSSSLLLVSLKRLFFIISHAI